MKDDVVFKVFLISIQEQFGILPVMNSDVNVKKVLSEFSEEEATKMKRKFRKIFRKLTGDRTLCYDDKRALIHRHFCSLARSKMKQNIL